MFGQIKAIGVYKKIRSSLCSAGFAVIASLPVFAASYAAAQTALETDIQEAYEQPASFRSKPLARWDKAGQPVSRRHPLLQDAPDEAIEAIKRHERKNVFGQSPRAFAKLPSEPKPNDRAEVLLGRAGLLNDPFLMHNKGLDKAELPESPWSGDYWAIYKGILGQRYLDPGFPWAQDWLKLFQYIQSLPFLAIFEGGDEEKIDQLATSEKYDLLVGDLQGTLTKNMWAQGKEYHDAYGQVETWMGICHGWAAAAVAVPRPHKSVRATVYDGKSSVSLLPSEIKGLISYLWATTPYESTFIGGRCNLKEVPKDENGRPTAPECHDTNPGTWHISVVNGIGVDKRSFVMDATVDYEVWNQPIHGYSIKYFNPATKKEVQHPKDATVALAEWETDPFRKYRSKKAKTILGVSMELQYVVEESANSNPEDSAENDVIYTVRYVYDLELDEKNRIVGGEWLQNGHPDFLWAPTKSAKPLNYEDSQLSGTWRVSEPTPQDWREAARWASEGGRVLSKIVDAIHKASNE